MNTKPDRPAAVRIELNPWYMVNDTPRQFQFLSYLRQVKEVCVVENENVVPLLILVDGQVLGMVDPYDGWETCSPRHQGRMVEMIAEFQPRVVFKYQWRRGVDYPHGTISAGYPCFRQVTQPEDLLTRDRPIDVIARMRVNQDYVWDVDLPWMIARSTIVEQAELLSRAGCNSAFGFAPAEQYEAELWNAKVGFDWRGSGYLTHRLVEYIRAGVVPITCPFGEEWPVREDVVLEDGVHGIFCSEPKQFANEAKLLLADNAKLNRIRRNLLELWQEKLCPAAQGKWIWDKLKATLTRSDLAQVNCVAG